MSTEIPEGMELKVLREIYKQYVSEFGHGLRNLEKFKITLVSDSRFEKCIPDIWEYNDSSGTKKGRLMPCLHELYIHGYMDKSPDNMYYWMTELGYNNASMSWYDKSLDYLNKNSGWAIPIAFLSLVVSIVALFVSK